MRRQAVVDHPFMIGVCSSKRKSSPHLALLLVCIVALALRFGIAFTFPNIHQADEIFQTVEQAHRLAYGTGMTPWEFLEGARSWLLPGVLAGVMPAGEALFGHNGGHLLGVWILLGLLSLAPVVCAYLWAYHDQGTIRAGVLAGLTCAVWFELVYFGPKSLSDVVSAHLLLFGAYLIRPDTAVMRGRQLFLAGVTLGLAVAIRPHLVPATLLILAWACRTAWSARLRPVALGTVMILLAAGVLDWVTWGAPFYSYWTYFRVNLIEGKAATFGVAPWYSYFLWLIETWSWGLPLVAGLVLWGARKQPILLAVAAVVVISHSFIQHKEYRFIYTAVTFAMVAAGIGLAEVGRSLDRTSLTRPRGVPAVVLLLVWIGTSAACAVTTEFRWNWISHRGFVRAFQELSRTADACGVGLWGMSNWHTAGYTYLHRDIPVFMPLSSKTFARLSPAMNYVLAFAKERPPNDNYTRGSCWDSGLSGKGPVCLYARHGACSLEPDLGEWHVR